MAYPATPKTWVAGDVLTAAQLNAELRDALLGAFPLGPPDVAWTAWTPTLTQSAVVTKTVNYAKYTKVGRAVQFAIDLSVTGAGTAANTVLVGLPPPAAAGPVGLMVGVMLIYDASATTRYHGNPELASASTVGMGYSQPNPSLFGITPAVTLASGDLVRLLGAYEAAT